MDLCPWSWEFSSCPSYQPARPKGSGSALIVVRSTDGSLADVRVADSAAVGQRDDDDDDAVDDDDDQDDDDDDDDDEDGVVVEEVEKVGSVREGRAWKVSG